MPSLDDLELIKKCDPSDMAGLIESFPVQVSDAGQIGCDFSIPHSFKSGYENIICTGLGGSAIGADIARSYTLGDSRTPILVNRNYTLPAFVGKRSLVVASSYSGNTEETLSAYSDAKTRLARIIAITSGGRLKNLAEKDGFPVVTIPGGLPPRAALGYSFFPLLILLSRIGVIKDRSGEIDETIKVLKYLKDGKLGIGVKINKNPAKVIAKSLYLKYPVIYGGQDHMDAVVTRWRGQLAENAKTISSSHILPEMNHNEIVGWDNPKKLLKDFAIVMLRDKGDHPRVSKRMDITKKIIENTRTKLITVKSCGKGLLARIFSLIYTGDFVSFYLAVLNGCDPTPVDRIAYLKKELAKI